MFKNYFSFLAILLFSCSLLIAQERPIEYSKKITITDGLAHNGVTSLLEDSKGFLWFGTYDGINKYDGYQLRTFKNSTDQDILTSNRIRSISEDNKGNIWFGTDDGISLYNSSLESFKKIYSNKIEGKGISGPIVRKIIICKTSDIVLCITERSGVLVFKDDYTLLKHFYPPKGFTNEDIRFFSGIQLDKTNYIFTTSIGLLEFNLDTEQFRNILKSEINYCASIIKINKNTLLATLLDGIATITFSNNQGNFIFKINQEALKTFQFRDALLDSLDHVWLSELNDGLVRIENTTSFIKGNPIKTKTFNDGLKTLRGSKLLKTTNNSCWFATFNEGLYQFDLDKNPFYSYSTKKDNSFELFSNGVKHIAAVDNNRVYLSDNLGSIALFNTLTHKFESLPFSLPANSKLKPKAVFVDSKENLWILMNDEQNITILKKNANGFQTFNYKHKSINGELFIRSFTEDKYGNIWIGTINDVIRIRIIESGEVVGFESLNDNPSFKNSPLSLARYVYADPLYDYIWIGADSDGLYRIENKKNTTIEDLHIDQFINDKNKENSISSNFVTSIIRLPNEEFWIGTEGGGICKVTNSNSTDPKFYPFTEKNGLSNNVVKSILYDEDLNLWVATNIGLNKFNTKDNKFRKFTDSDGLPFEDFWFASNQLNNGSMVLSGLDGFCYFNPKEITYKEELPKLQFENFKIFNTPIYPTDTIKGRVILEKSLTELDEITLKYNENVFSLNLTSLHYSNPENKSLKYRLLPLNEEWIEVPSSENTVQYNGLQPDEYTLSVMASNSLNEWTEPKHLKIIIKPAFWNTTMAYFIYFLLLSLLVYAVIRVILKIQTLNHKVEIEQLEIDSVKQLNEAKLRYFSNISHEIKTPLTLLSGPLDTLLDRFRANVDVNEKLSLMRRQSKKMQQLIEQVHDFRRADANLLKMEYSRFNFDSFVQELLKDFKYLAKTSNKTIKILRGNTPIIVSADKDKLEKIFNNLLSNALKHTKNEDTITFGYKSDEKDLIVNITDTGHGIDSEDLPHVFERFYQSHQKKNAHKSGSGIGLAFSKRLVEMHYGFINVESEIEKGTTFTVRLPIVKKHLESDVIEDFVLPEEEEIMVDNHLMKKVTPSNIEVSGDFSESMIFYAEDNQEMRNYVSGLLSQFFKVKSFRNGQECLDAMEDEWPDIVISDVQMPELNGLDLCIRIKSDLKTSHIPVILLTALTNIKDHLQGIRDGADAYIKKPFNVQRLITNTEALLLTRKQLRERYQVGIPLTKENNKNNRNDNAFLDKLYSLMEENLDNQGFDLNNLAKELYLNRTHFYQKVKVLTNTTPFELLKMYRLKKAAEFLVQKNLSVNEVFVMTGFKSRTHFTKIFKEKYNVSPSKYAAETRKKHDVD